MAVEQLPGQVQEFAQYFNGLLSRLDQAGGWCGVFWQRDPEGMRAFLEGEEVPPWDVVQAVLQDLAAGHGDGAAAQEAGRARTLHAASLAAYDVRPGGRDALHDRLDVMLREQRYAAERLSELGRALPAAATAEEADSLRLDLAWARDDHDRATARCAELRDRIDAVDRRPADGPVRGARPLPPVVGDGSPDGFPAGGPGWAAGPRPGAQRPAPDEDDWPDLWRDASADRAARRDAAAPASHRSAPSDPAGSPAPAGSADLHVSSVPAASGGPAVAPGRDGFFGPDMSSDPDGPSDLSGSDDLRAYSDPRPGFGPRPGNEPRPGFDARPALPAPPAPGSPPASTPSPAPRHRFKRRLRGGARGSARFAGMTAADAAARADAEPEWDTEDGTGTPAPSAPLSPPAPRGARFPDGATDRAQPDQRPRQRREPLDDEARRTTVETVHELLRLRREGRSGEAHAVLVEAAYWPAARLPLLAAELHRAGLGADWANLLWEAVSLPVDRLVAAADALVAAGRAADGEQMLRQGVVRPAQEIGDAVLELVGRDRHREVRALLDAYVRVRTPEEAVRSIDAEPQLLAPLLLEAARDVSEQRYWDLVHALRVAGYTA